MFEQNHIRGSRYPFRSALCSGHSFLRFIPSFQLTNLRFTFAVTGFLGVDFDIFPAGEPGRRALQCPHLPRAWKHLIHFEKLLLLVPWVNQSQTLIWIGNESVLFSVSSSTWKCKPELLTLRGFFPYQDVVLVQAVFGSWILEKFLKKH